MKQRNQLSTSKQQLMTMNDQLKDRLNYIHQLEGDLTLIRNEEKYRIQTHEEALKVLEDKVSVRWYILGLFIEFSTLQSKL